MTVIRFTQGGDYQLEGSLEATVFQDRHYSGTEGFGTLSYSADLLFFVAGDGQYDIVAAGDVQANAATDGIYADFSQEGLSFALVGGERGDVLIGGNNSDELFGAGGDDLLVGGASGDSFGGGDGTDTVSYASASSGVIVGGYSQLPDDGLGDTFESIEIIIGSAHNDQFTTSGDTYYRGGDGADTFFAYGTGPLEGGGGADTFDDEGNGLSITYQNADGGVVAHTDNPQPNTGDAAGDIFYGSVSSLTGSEFDDELSSPSASLFGLGGNDLLQGGLNSNTFDGGEGSDTASYANAGGGIRASLGGSSGNTGEAAGDTYTSVENLTGSDFNDVLFGDAKANVLNGGARADRLVGQKGDSLLGGAGADALVVTGSPARIDGGSERDTLTIAAGADVVFTADTISGIETILIRAGATLDLSAVEEAAGTIRLSGSSSVTTRVKGSQGNDTISADGGVGGVTVEIAGGEGDDLVRLQGRLGQLEVSGGFGQDTLVIGDTNGWLATPVEILSANESSVGFGFETVILRDGARLNLSNVSDAPDRIVLRTTEDGFAFLRASGGDDLILGGDGQDYMVGSHGADTMSGGANADLFVFRSLEEMANAESGATDFIRDFSHLEGDQIDLHNMFNIETESPYEFSFIGTDAFTGAGGTEAEVRIQEGRNGNSFVQFDIDHDGVVDAFFRVRSDAVLTESDFILIAK
jgi:hypothetical protein